MNTNQIPRRQLLKDAASNWAHGFHGNQPPFDQIVLAFKAGAKWQLELPVKLPVKDSGGEEGRIVNATEYMKQLEEKFIPPTPINPSEPEERKWNDEDMINAYLGGKNDGDYFSNPAIWLFEYKLKTSNP